jgi:integrase
LDTNALRIRRHPSIRSHNRHTACTLALAAGVPVQQVQRHLRHKKIETTLRYDCERDVRKNPTLDMMPGLG